MLKQYKHTQIGYLTICALTIGLLFSAYLMAVYAFDPILLAILIIFSVCMILFATLTVIIEKDILKIRFGVGIIQKRFALKDIESCRIVKNPWYYGWGIRLTPHGWLYSVSGFSAVEITMRTGKKYRIGTDVTDDLVKAIRESIEKGN